MVLPIGGYIVWGMVMCKSADIYIIWLNTIDEKSGLNSKSSKFVMYINMHMHSICLPCQDWIQHKYTFGSTDMKPLELSKKGKWDKFTFRPIFKEGLRVFFSSENKTKQNKKKKEKKKEI